MYGYTYIYKIDTPHHIPAFIHINIHTYYIYLHTYTYLLNFNHIVPTYESFPAVIRLNILK